MTRPKTYAVVIVLLSLGFLWDFGPRQLARMVYIALWSIAPAPFPGAETPDRFTTPQRKPTP